MSLGHGTSIVRDGLLLYLDAANIKSYSGSGSSFNDMSGNNNIVTLVNGVAYSSNNNGVLLFDGLDDYINVGDVYDNGTGEISICFWVNFSGFDPTNNNPIVINKNSTGSNRIFIGYAGGRLAVRTEAVGGTTFFDNNNSITTDKWYNFVFTRKGSNIKLLVNKNVIIESASATTGDIGNTEWYVMARPGTSEYVAGKLGCFMIYNKELSDAEIQKNFEALRGRYGI